MSVGNSKPIDFPIVGSFGEDQVGKVNSERTINAYEVFSQNGKKRKYLAPWPGLKQKYTFSEGANGRAAETFLDAAYFVVKKDVYRLNSALTLTRISSGSALFTTDSGPVGIAANEFQLAFVDGVRLLIWDNNTATLTDETATLPAGVIPKDITFINGYFVLVDGSTVNRNRFYISSLNNGKIWNLPTGDFALVNSKPTILSACATLGGRVFLFGESKTEIWTNTGQSNFPLRRDNNMIFEHGVKARQSVSQGFGVLFYLSSDQDGVGSVMMSSGSSPAPVSTREVDEVIQNFSNPDDATGEVLKVNGQVFYLINFTTDNRSFLYNLNTGKWSENEALDGTRYVVNAHAYFKNKHWVAGYNDDILYELNEQFVSIERTAATERIKITRIAQVMSVPTYNRIRIDKLRIDMLQGVGLPNIIGPDSDPVIFLSISEDGGVTYQNYGSKPIGESGQRLASPTWFRLGIRRDAIIKVEMFNNVIRYIIGAAMNIEVIPE